MVTINYELYTNQGQVLGVVSVTGEDEEDCNRQIEAYLNTKQQCYCLPIEDEGGHQHGQRVSDQFQRMMNRLLPLE